MSNLEPANRPGRGARSRSSSDVSNGLYVEGRALSALPSNRVLSLNSARQNNSRFLQAEFASLEASTMLSTYTLGPVSQTNLMSLPITNQILDAMQDDFQFGSIPARSQTWGLHSQSSEKLDLGKTKENVAPVTQGVPPSFNSLRALPEATKNDPRDPVGNIPVISKTSQENWNPRNAASSLTVSPQVSNQSLVLAPPDPNARESSLKHLRSVCDRHSQQLLNLELRNTLEDPFEARYTATFDVFYNTRRFFEGSSKTILDSTLRVQLTSPESVNGKSIYGIYLQDVLPSTTDFGESRQVYDPPSTTGAKILVNELVKQLTSDRSCSSREAEVSTSAQCLEKFNNTSDEILYNENYAFAPDPHHLHQDRNLGSSVHDSARSKKSLRIQPRSKRLAFRAGRPRSPFSSVRKRSPPLKPRAVMAWWKERERDTTSVGPTTLSFIDATNNPLMQNEREEKEKFRRLHPLRRISSLFGLSRRSSKDSFKLVGKFKKSCQSLHSLPSQFSLPECREGTPSFITTSIGKNYHTPTESSRPVSQEIIKVRQTSTSSSVVQQRISSFETPREQVFEKKCQTSPSYQLLSTIKPVRGRSLKDRFEAPLRSGSFQSKNDVPSPFANSSPSPTVIQIQDQAWEKNSKDKRMLEIEHDPASASRHSPLSTDLLENFENFDEPYTPVGSCPGLWSPHSDRTGVAATGSNSTQESLCDAEIVLSSPDFSDPQIVTSTPPCYSRPNTPIILSHGTSIHDEEDEFSHLKIFSNDNFSAASNPVVLFSDFQNQGSSDKIVQNIVQEYEPSLSKQKPGPCTAILSALDPDDNKENIPPETSDPEIALGEDWQNHLDISTPDFPPRTTSRTSEANQLEGSLESSANRRNTEEFISSKGRNWRRQSIRMVKSALGSFRARVSGSIDSKINSGLVKKRASVLDFFKIPRNDTVNSTVAPVSNTSFRILPTVSGHSADHEPELQPNKNKSILSTRLGRKKKPILTVPKYSKKTQRRGNIFGLFDFARAPPSSSFVVYSSPESKTTATKSNPGFKRATSRISRRLSLNVLPFIKRRGVSAPTARPPLSGPQYSLEEVQNEAVSNPSPLPQLELRLSHSEL
ncbi:hypothetical protein AA313_de0206199 [Arthrobotrys entomopaga]|nr:hypothetical protein AA313_de0206199 [Arthrobotrys entomopaga]